MAQPATSSNTNAPDPFELDRQLEELLDRIELAAPGTLPDRPRPKPASPEPEPAEPQAAEQAAPPSETTDPPTSTQDLVDEAVGQHIDQAEQAEREADNANPDDAAGITESPPPEEAVASDPDPQTEAKLEAETEAEAQPSWVADLESVLDEIDDETKQETPAASPASPDAEAQQPEAIKGSDEVTSAIDGLLDESEDIKSVAEMDNQAPPATEVTEDASTPSSGDLDSQLKDLIGELQEPSPANEASESQDPEQEPEGVVPDEVAALEDLDAALAEQVEAELQGEFDHAEDADAGDDVSLAEAIEQASDARPVTRVAPPAKDDYPADTTSEDDTPEGDFQSVEQVTKAPPTASTPREVSSSTEADVEQDDDAPEGDFETVEQATTNELGVIGKSQAAEEAAALAAMEDDSGSNAVAAELDEDAKRTPPQRALSRDASVDRPTRNRLDAFRDMTWRFCVLISRPLMALPTEVRQTLGYIGLLNVFTALVLLLYVIVF
ncbi:MAG: hypothetical protein RIG82_08975 [Phycisphaeraceae bacterium]